MYVMPRDLTGSSDLSSYFDDDFFNSSIIYQFPRIGELSYAMSYLAREDLISSEVYDNSRYLGVVLMSVGSTVDKEPNGDIFTHPEFEPLTEITLKSLNEMRNAQMVTVSKNELTDKEINPRRNPDHEYYVYNSSKRFQPVPSD